MTDRTMAKVSFDVPVKPAAPDERYAWLPIEYTDEDVKTVRELAEQYMEFATLPVQAETAENWAGLNDLQRVRPMLWHNEIPWHEMNVNDELTMKTSAPFVRRIEADLRRRIYLWRHMPADMVLEPVFYSPMIIDNTGTGLSISEETVATDESNNIVGHKFLPVIRCRDDLEKIINPVLSLDKEKTEATYQAYKEIFGSAMPVEIIGAPGFWFAPIDDVVMYMGTNELLMNVVLDPDLVHASMQKICSVYMSVLDQYEQLGCIASNNMNCRIGSGAYGYSRVLGRGTAAGMHCGQIWGSCASQFFTSVSPDMQREFCLPYEKKWLERFGYSYYGCCERLDHKIDVISEINNLRKISCSPWSKVEHMAEICGRKYVVSLKPSPAVFAFDHFDEQYVIEDMKKKMSILKDCNFEIVIKDISTVKYDPSRLWRWVEIVHELCKNAQ